VIDGRYEVGRHDRIGQRISGVLVALAMDHAAADATAGQNAGEAAGPMVAAVATGSSVAVSLADFGRAAKFACPDDERFIQHAAAG